jgi:nitrate reductase gamma subunit
MKIFLSLIAVLALILFAWIGSGAGGLQFFIGAVFPPLAMAIFIFGVVYRIIKWARSPVPFHIPTTCGQQKSLPWIKPSRLDNPHGTLGVIGRMALEILFFRSLFRNTKTELKNGPRLVYGSAKYLWLGALVFHWSFLIIILRHFRFFTEPTPAFANLLSGIDGFFQIWVPVLYMTDIFIAAGLAYLFFRRAASPQLRYFSLPSDYFVLFLLIGIVATGILMRYFTKVDLISVKQLTLGLFSFNPIVPEGIGSIFYIHLFLVSVLLAYFPASKLVHMAGVFLSPTRNLSNNSRVRRHNNPWNYPVKTHTYEEYEDEFRELMRNAGLPLEKEK